MKPHHTPTKPSQHSPSPPHPHLSPRLIDQANTFISLSAPRKAARYSEDLSSWTFAVRLALVDVLLRLGGGVPLGGGRGGDGGGARGELCVVGRAGPWLRE